MQQILESKENNNDCCKTVQETLPTFNFPDTLCIEGLHIWHIPQIATTVESAPDCVIPGSFYLPAAREQVPLKFPRNVTPAPATMSRHGEADHMTDSLRVLYLLMQSFF